MSDNQISAGQKLSEALAQYEALVFSLCYRITGNYFDSQDLTQETFLSYYEALSSFDGRNEKAFLCRIATNKALDYVRSAKRREIPSENSFLDINLSAIPPPESQVLDAMIQEELRKTCLSLKAPYNTIAEAYFCQNMTAAEIADSAGRKLKTVQTQIARSRKMLRRIYSNRERKKLTDRCPTASAGKET